MERTCTNCHFWNSESKDSLDICFNGLKENNCFGRKDHPNWVPMTNGDRVRMMTDEEIAKLRETEIDSKYRCAESEKPFFAKCEWWPHYGCGFCPNTFLNWLRAPAEEVKINDGK